MTLQLPEPIARAVQPLLDARPLSEAMSRLVVTGPERSPTVAVVERILLDPALAAQPRLQAGLWLYVDELDRSHLISQALEDATGSFWHGIMHRREGDFWNSHYWFRRAGHHPAMKRIEGYDGHAFIDQVEAAHQRGKASEALIRMQRSEWAALFAWCCEQGG